MEVDARQSHPVNTVRMHGEAVERTIDASFIAAATARLSFSQQSDFELDLSIRNVEKGCWCGCEC